MKSAFNDIKDQFIGDFEKNDILIHKSYIDSEEKYIRLYHTKFTPKQPTKTICIIHGFGEHSGRFYSIAEWYASLNFEVLLIDCRGFGYSGAPRGCSTADQLQNDILLLLEQANPNLPLFIYSHSMGGLITIRLLIDNPFLPVSGCIITSPLLGFPKDRNMSWAKVFILKQIGDSLDDIIINSMVNPTALTKNNNFIQQIFEDRLMIPFLSVKMAKSLYQCIEYVKKKFKDFKTPAIIFHGKQDKVTNYEDSKRLVYDNVMPYKQLHLFQQGYHQLQHDKQRNQLLEKSIQFINQLPPEKITNWGYIDIKSKLIYAKQKKNHIYQFIIETAGMGIHKLMDLIRSNAPDAIKKRDIKYYSGMSIAMDASMSMYQFLISTQGVSSDANFLTTLTDSEGNKTGHLLGLFNRTILMIQNGLKPVWVFDGKPPTKKNGELLRRRKIKQEATEKKNEAQEIGNIVEALKQQQRTTYISKQEKQDAMTMLKLMGVPVIQAPGEAEAQCSFMNKTGLVDAVCTEDTDCLVFGTQLMLRDLNHKKQPLTEIDRQVVLKSLELTNEQFIDMCILCGCDYASKIEGIGPVKAYKFIKQMNSIETILKFCEEKNLKDGKINFIIPKTEDFNFEETRQLFQKPTVQPKVELKWQKNIDEESLKQFLIKGKNFAQSRIQIAIKKIKSNKGTQPRLQAFFGKPTVTKSIQLMKKQDKNRNKKSRSKGKK